MSYVRSHPTGTTECCHFYFTVDGPIVQFVLFDLHYGRGFGIGSRGVD
jgi:hypothetical protein